MINMKFAEGCLFILPEAFLFWALVIALIVVVR